MTNNHGSRTVSDSAHEVLTQLLQILASSRGGNATLASMLRVKIAQINDQQPAVLLVGPGRWIEKGIELWNRSELSSWLPSQLIEPSSDGQNLASQQPEIQQTRHPDGQTILWESNIHEELSASFSSPSDLHEQLYNFDGSFDHSHVIGAWDRFLVDIS